MKLMIDFFTRKTSWYDVVNAARTTINKTGCSELPKSDLKYKLLLAEHSPIRELFFSCSISNLKSWISVHLVRHKIGIEHFVSTQREDRTGIDRDEKRQDSLVTHRFTANAQAIINISRKRLCSNAHKETRETWQEVLRFLKVVDEELYNVCVPDCVYRGFCYEIKTCGYYLTDDFKKKLIDYRNLINR